MTKKLIATFFLDKKLHNRFKIYCAKAKSPMSRVLAVIIESFLNKK